MDEKFWNIGRKGEHCRISRMALVGRNNRLKVVKWIKRHMCEEYGASSKARLGPDIDKGYDPIDVYKAVGHLAS